jgi:CubicO group peptidase (beta-lactamase class C family)
MVQTRSVRPAALIASLLLSCAVSLPAQQVVKKEAPPELRALLDGFVKAVNSGSPEAWEAFAQERFSPALLKTQSAEERKQQYERLRAALGNIAFDRVTRRGPDAPLELNVKGSTGTSGVISLELEESSPMRIANLALYVGAKEREPAADGVPPPPVNGGMPSDELNRVLDGYFSTLAADEVFSGVALVARNGVPVFYKAYGFADRTAKTPNTIRTRFNIGSINKTFTQAAITQLIRDGRLSSTDTLGKFFPDYPQEASRGATVEQLLTHRAGVADFFGPEFTRAPKSQFRSNADYFRFVGTLPPAFAPGTGNQYCNGCYIALGAIVERVSGMPYENYVAEHVFRRAEMTNTGYPHSDRPEPDIAIGYTRRGSSGEGRTDAAKAAGSDLRSNIDMHGATGSAAGGGYSTAMDLLTYVKAVRAGRFPGAEANMGIAGGAPGINAVVEAEGEWVVIVLSNFDPPSASRVGLATMEALRR